MEIIAALLLAGGGQPALPPEPIGPAPVPGSYGWLGELAGSCFRSTAAQMLRTRRDCFSIENGFLVVATRETFPRHVREVTCRFEPLGEASFILRCNDGSAFEEIARLQGDSVVFSSRDERSRVSTPRDRWRVEWRLVAPDQIEISTRGPSRVLPHPLGLGPTTMRREGETVH